MGKPSLPRGHARQALIAVLLATTAFTLAPGAPATAQQIAIGSFDIPPGDLNAALAAFGRQSGLQVSYPSAIAAGRTSPGFSGQAGAQTALNRILQGTGLGHRFVASDMVVISAVGPDQTAAAPGTTMLDAITIYGDRSATTLSESRNSVAVLQGEDLTSPSNPTIRDAFRRMGNVSAGDWADSGVMIRGVNSEGFTPLGAPLASLYVDGVQQTRNAVRRGTRGLFDTEQIEVYRGPQSTLSGRAALAGAIYLRTKDPEFERSGAAQVTYGSENHRQVGLAFGDALGDRLAYRISAEWSEQDSDLNYPSYAGYGRYDDFITDKYYNLRGKLLWLPTGDETTRVLFSYARAYDSPTEESIAGPAWSPFSPGLSYTDHRGDLWGAELSSYGVALPAWTEIRENRVDSFGIEVTHDLSDRLRLSAITGITRSQLDRNSINAGDPGDIHIATGHQDQRILSQELRLNYDDGPTRWVAGVYGALERDRADYGSFPHVSVGQSYNSSTQDVTNLAVFGEASHEFLPGWSVIGGARIDHIDKDQTLLIMRDGVVTSVTKHDYRDTVFLPKLGMQYEFENGHRLSLIYQEGYRPGGSGVKVSDDTPFSFGPEKARNLELSWRGSAVDERLQVGANVFYMTWRDQQVELNTEVGNPQSAVIRNAARSASYGAELDLTYAATDQLNLFASIGLLHTEFKDFNQDGWGDFSGQPFPNAPEQSIAIGVRWAQEAGWFAAASAKYVSSSVSRLEEGVSSPVDLDAHTIVDAEIGYDWDRARITAYATNLFDKEYFVYESGPGALATLGKRREVGLRLDYRF